MNFVALIIALLAAVIFAFEASQTRPFGRIATGLFFLDVAWILQLTWVNHQVTFH